MTTIALPSCIPVEASMPRFRQTQEPSSDAFLVEAHAHSAFTVHHLGCAMGRKRAASTNGTQRFERGQQIRTEKTRTTYTVNFECWELPSKPQVSQLTKQAPRDSVDCTRGSLTCDRCQFSPWQATRHLFRQHDSKGQEMTRITCLSCKMWETMTSMMI
jgi:hypothetical protein